MLISVQIHIVSRVLPRRSERVDDVSSWAVDVDLVKTIEKRKNGKMGYLIGLQTMHYTGPRGTSHVDTAIAWTGQLSGVNLN